MLSVLSAYAKKLSSYMSEPSFKKAVFNLLRYYRFTKYLKEFYGLVATDQHSSFLQNPLLTTIITETARLSVGSDVTSQGQRSNVLSKTKYIE